MQNKSIFLNIDEVDKEKKDNKTRMKIHAGSKMKNIKKC